MICIGVGTWSYAGEGNREQESTKCNVHKHAMICIGVGTWSYAGEGNESRRVRSAMFTSMP